MRGIKGEATGPQIRERIKVSDTEFKVNKLHYELLSCQWESIDDIYKENLSPFLNSMSSV
jgi:hypothetical protein